MHCASRGHALRNFIRSALPAAGNDVKRVSDLSSQLVQSAHQVNVELCVIHDDPGWLLVYDLVRQVGNQLLVIADQPTPVMFLAKTLKQELLADSRQAGDDQVACCCAECLEFVVATDQAQIELGVGALKLADQRARGSAGQAQQHPAPCEVLGE